MSMSSRVGLILAIIAPTIMLLIVGAVVRICRLVFVGQGAQTSRGNHLQSSRSVSPDKSIPTPARRSGIGHH